MADSELPARGQDSTVSQTGGGDALGWTDHSVAELLYRVVHDLRAPLRSIEAFARLTTDRHERLLDTEGCDYLRRIGKGTSTMNGLLDDLDRFLAVLELKPNRRALDGQELVRLALERLGERPKSAKLQVAPDLPALHVDANWATVAVAELVDNAIKFAPEGEVPCVEIAAWIQERELGLSVRDRGPGIPAEHTERIFELFRRLAGPGVAGRGAGLAIARAIAAKHDGRLWFQPRPGGGSVFVLTFGASTAKGNSPGDPESARP